MTEEKKALARVYAAMILFFMHVVTPTVVNIGDGVGSRVFNLSFLLILFVLPYRYASRRALRWLRGEELE